MRLAIFSDVYSNPLALEAVLADMAAVDADHRYCLGDLVAYAPWPNETLELLQREDIPIVMGQLRRWHRLRPRRMRLRLHGPDPGGSL